MIKPLPDHGEPVRIVLFDESQCGSDTLVQLWQIFRDEHLPQTFWHDGVMLSLAEFIRFFDPNHKRLLFVAFLEGDSEPTSWERCAGVAWLEGVTPGHKAQGHFIIRRQHWGYGRPERIMRQGLRDIFEQLQLQVITCQLHEDNAPALAMLDRLGWHRVGTVPAWFRDPQTNSYRGTVLGYLLPEDIIQTDSAVGLNKNGVAHVAL